MSLWTTRPNRTDPIVTVRTPHSHRAHGGVVTVTKRYAHRDQVTLIDLLLVTLTDLVEQIGGM